MRDKLMMDGAGDQFSDNDILRFFYSAGWNVERARKALLKHIEFLKTYDYSRLDMQEIRPIISGRSAVVHKTDIYGRPVVYMRIRLSQASQVSSR